MLYETWLDFEEPWCVCVCVCVCVCTGARSGAVYYQPHYGPGVDSAS